MATRVPCSCVIDVVGCVIDVIPSSNHLIALLQPSHCLRSMLDREIIVIREPVDEKGKIVLPQTCRRRRALTSPTLHTRLSVALSRTLHTRLSSKYPTQVGAGSPC